MKVLRLFNVIFSTFLLVCPAVFAGNGVNSPYSRHGLGLLGDHSASLNKSIGGTGCGLRLSNSINLINPASYSSVDTLTMLFDAGFTLQTGSFTEGNVKVNARNAGFDYAAMQFRLAPKVGMTLALTPYSIVGYDFYNTSVVRDKSTDYITTTNTYTANGGLREVIAGIGWSPVKYVAIGADAAYLFGEISHKIKNTYSASTVYPANREYFARLRAIRTDFGLQFVLPFKKNESQLVAGAKFQPGVSIKGNEYIYNTSYNNEGDARPIGSDTVCIENAFSLPQQFSAGISYVNSQFVFAADYTLAKWSNAKAFNKAGKDMTRLSVGVMYTPEATSKKYFRRTTYSAGAYCQSSYYYLDNGNSGPKEIGISAGMKLPLINSYNTFSTIAVSGQYVMVTPFAKGQIRENYFKINLGITFNDRWFAKWQVQ
ncbi:MAG: hypothetical protein MJY71_01495 [Bacteroidaceae bacterium]|nr:hypothetical protein [Bacteroidaceae bacterium]